MSQLSDDERRELAQAEAGIDQSLAGLRESGRELYQAKAEMGVAAFWEFCKSKNYNLEGIDLAIELYIRGSVDE